MAPAERSAEADGEGGGSTTPEECESVGRLDGCEAVSVDGPLGDADSAVALPPPSEDSFGIWTFNCGLDPPPPVRRLLEREGGVNVVSGTVGIGPPPL